MNLIQLFTICLMISSLYTVFKYMREPRRGSRYHTMVLLVLWTVVIGGYIISK